MAKGRSTQAKPQLPELAGSCGWMLRWADRQVGIPFCGLTLGRSRTCDVVLDHPEVSRRHARIVPMAGAPWIFDQGSSNSVVVNGEATARRRLEAGDRIWLGPIVLDVVEGNGPLPEDLRQAWSNLADARASALRELAGASNCRLEADGSFTFDWEPGTDRDGMGPLRTTLVETAMGNPAPS